MLTVAISGLPNRILRFTVRHGCEPCRTVEGRKSNKNGHRHTADYRYGTVRSPSGDVNKKKTKTNSSKQRVGLREKLELKRNVQGVGSPFFFVIPFRHLLC